MGTLDVVRVDKWLWSVRLYKNRAEATQACGRNEVQVDGQVAKASRNVKVGMKIDVKHKGFDRTFLITELAQKPVGNDRGHLFYEETTDANTLDTIQREKEFKTAQSRGFSVKPVLKQPKEAQKYQKDKKGRMTKKQRRDWDSAWEG